jgi:hypothetical protein
VAKRIALDALGRSRVMDERDTKGKVGWLKRLIAGLAILILLALVAGLLYQETSSLLDARKHPPPGQLVDVGNHLLHIHCLGEGSPAVILETGLDINSTSTIWGLVQPELAQPQFAPMIALVLAGAKMDRCRVTAQQSFKS